MGANDAIVVSEHDEASETGVLGVGRVKLRQKMSVVHGHLTSNVVLALENLDLGEHLLFVVFDSLFDDRGKNTKIAFSAS